MGWDYVQGRIMYGGDYLWQGQKGEKDSQHLQSFNSGN